MGATSEADVGGGGRAGGAAGVGGGDLLAAAVDHLRLLEPLVRLRQLYRLSVGGLEATKWQLVCTRFTFLFWLILDLVCLSLV